MFTILNDVSSIQKYESNILFSHFAGRRPRVTATAKGQLKISATIVKKDCKPLRKMATHEMTSEMAIETITQRTRNLRKSLHKIQKQFDNQAITKFFQRTLKAHSFSQFGSDSDENACDAFTADQLTNLSGNNNELAKCDDEAEEQHIDTNAIHDVNVTDNVASNICTTNGGGDGGVDEHNENSNGSAQFTTNSIQPTNIFLQKPVLHLNIDKSLIQASSIVINKHLDAGINFATSFSAFNHSVLNTANKEIQSKSSEDDSSAEQNDVQSPNDTETKGQKTYYEKPRLRKRRPRKCASRWAIDNALLDALNDSDSNSCDSGVVSDRSFELSSTDGNKPTTPHRIVCPSTSTPTNEVAPIVQTQPMINRNNLVKRVVVKRAQGKQIHKA